MIRSIKVRLNPNNKQLTKLFQYAGCARFAYNWAIDRNVKYSVADYGNLEHCKKLLQDKDEKVRNHAYNRIKEIEYNELCQKRNKERELKREALINNEINDKPNNKPNNKIVKYEIVQ